MRDNIKEVQFYDFGQQPFKPTDAGILKNLSGLHDSLASKAVDVEINSERLMKEARRQYFSGEIENPDFHAVQQAFVSMKTGNCCVIIGY